MNFGRRPSRARELAVLLATALIARAAAASVADGVEIDDGSAGAPAGAPAHPHLFANYRTRPSWRVAGVDYHVGFPEGLRLKDPTRLPARDGPFVYGEGMVVCRAPNQTFEGYDMTGHGGVGLTVEASCRNLTYANNSWRGGSNCTFAINNTQAPGLTVIRSEFDGGGGVTTTACGRNGQEVLYLLGGGDITVKYNHLLNTAQHFLAFGANGAPGGRLDVRYNLEERCGFAQGAHCNGFQVSAGRWDHPVIAYNTYISGQPDTALSVNAVSATPSGRFEKGSNIVTAYGPSIGIAYAGGGPKLAYNPSLAAGMSVTSPCLPAGTKLVTTPYGYAPDLVLSAKSTCAPGIYRFDVPNAYPSGMVIAIHYAAQLGGPSNPAALTDGLISHNTIVSTGPIRGMAFGLECDPPSGTPNNTASGTTLIDNYIDATGMVSTPIHDQCGDSLRRRNMELARGAALP